MSTAQLVLFPISHFCERAEWALQHCNVTYEVVAVAPPFHRFFTGGKSVPVLRVGEELIFESSRICYYASSKAQERLGPHLNDADESIVANLGVAARVLVYATILPDTELALRVLGAHDERIPQFQRSVLSATFSWALRPLFLRAFDTSVEGCQRARDTISKMFDECERLLDAGLIGGDAADLTHFELSFCAVASPLVCPPEHALYDQVYSSTANEHPFRALVDEYRETRVGKFVLETYRKHRKSAQ